MLHVAVSELMNRFQTERSEERSVVLLPQRNVSKEVMTSTRQTEASTSRLAVSVASPPEQHDPKYKRLVQKLKEVWTKEVYAVPKVR